MACRLSGAKPLSESLLPHCQIDTKEHISVKFHLNFNGFHSRKCTWKCCLRNGGQFVLAPMCSAESVFMSWHHPDLTHWGRVTHICVGKLTIIGSDNGLSPGRRQAIVWTIAGILQIGPLGTNFSEILIGIQTFSLKKMHLKMLSAKWCPFV